VDGPLEAGVAVGVAVEVNSPGPAEVDPPEFDPLPMGRPPLEATLAVGWPCEEDGEVDEDALRAKACSSPNSRLALLADFRACACVEVGWPVKPPACVVPGTAPVSR
jgi:hypothetical protein